ncbi:MAG: 2-phospho-L-lactate guanylyltransferase [Thermomicrobiales bacterium]
MRVHALIPVKGLADAKSRLMPLLTEDARATLMIEMLRHVVEAARESAVLARITVVSPDPAVLELATTWEVAALRQRTVGLNPGLDEARADAIARSAEAILVLHADLPRLRPDEITAMVHALASPPAVVIAPDHTQSGTNALLIAPPGALPFHFGPGSLALHIAAAERNDLIFAIARAPGMAGDVDTPHDLREFVGNRRG